MRLCGCLPLVAPIRAAALAPAHVPRLPTRSGCCCHSTVSHGRCSACEMDAPDECSLQAHPRSLLWGAFAAIRACTNRAFGNRCVAREHPTAAVWTQLVLQQPCSRTAWGGDIRIRYRRVHFSHCHELLLWLPAAGRSHPPPTCRACPPAAAAAAIQLLRTTFTMC